MKRFWKNSVLFLVLVFASVLMNGCSSEELLKDTAQEKVQDRAQDTVEDFAQGLPDYTGNPYVEVHDNQPSFAEQDMEQDSFESYSDLDAKGRCGVAFACVGQDLMPPKKRGNISHIKPSGWQKARYDFVEGKNLYNRCHLIAHQLTGEDANEKNLITGTRYFNVEGMLPFENQVADYVKETNHHVLYRVTPYYKGDNLVASGVQIEGYSLEDKGAGICFNVYVFNVQPGVVIDYATGESAKEDTGSKAADKGDAGENTGDKDTRKVDTEKSAGNKNTEKADTEKSAKNKNTEKADAEKSTKKSRKKDAQRPDAEQDDSEQDGQSGTGADQADIQEYVLNTNTKKFHSPGCRYVKTIKPENSQTVNATRDELTRQGYDACKVCMP